MPSTRVHVRRAANSIRVALMVSVVGSGALMSGAAAAQSARVHGVDIVPWSKKMGDGRYRSGRDFAKTLKFFRDNFRGSKRVRWHAEVNLPQVKYKHLENLSKKRKWDGVNIYELPKGQVYIYVLEHVEAPETPAAGSAKKGAKTSALPTLIDLNAMHEAFADAPEADMIALVTLLLDDSK